MKRYLLMLMAYWIIASISFIWIPILFNSSCPVVILRCCIGTILAFIFLILMVFLLRDRPLAVIFLPLLAPAASLTYNILSSGKLTLRAAFCAWSVLVFIFSFIGVIFFEKVQLKSEPQRNLMHHRYIEYLRSFIWLVIFGIVGFLTWEKDVLGHINLPAMPPQDSAIMGLLQLICVFSGIGFVAYAFHVKLKQIEETPT